MFGEDWHRDLRLILALIMEQRVWKSGSSFIKSPRAFKGALVYQIEIISSKRLKCIPVCECMRAPTP